MVGKERRKEGKCPENLITDVESMFYIRLYD